MVYYEGMEIRDDWRHIEEVEYLSDWYENISAFPLMSGYVPTGDGGHRYRIGLDARHCRKVFIEAHAVKQFGGKVFFIDADVFTHSPVSEAFLDSVLPDDKMCCYLGRDWFYTESGFIGFNSDHPACQRFMSAYVNVVLSGSIFTRNGWHDCYAFDATREVMNTPELFNDLAKDLPGKVQHPFINSVLGSVMDHRKGLRKSGKSHKEDLVVERTEPYWKDELVARA